VSSKKQLKHDRERVAS